MKKHNEIAEKLRTYFQNIRSPDIVSVYLFGSRVDGIPSQKSDLDIGILVRRGIFLPNPMLFSLMEGVEQVVIPLKPDVKILNELPVRVVHTMLKHSQLVFCADDIADADFREDLYQKYFDLKPLLQEFIDAL